MEAALQYRRRGPGRPTAKGKGRSLEEKAVAELKSREKSDLDTQRHKYKVPTVRLLFDMTRTPILIDVLQQGIDMEMCPSEEEDGDAEQDQEPPAAKKVRSV